MSPDVIGSPWPISNASNPRERATFGIVAFLRNAVEPTMRRAMMKRRIPARIGAAQSIGMRRFIVQSMTKTVAASKIKKSPNKFVFSRTRTGWSPA